MDVLPDEILQEICLLMNLTDLTDISRSSKLFNRGIWNNAQFWRSKFIHDYGYAPKNFLGDWKQLYLNYNNVYG